MTGLARADHLIVALDYCLSCRGTCPTCVLGDKERLINVPAMSRERAVAALAWIADRFPDVGHLALGIGRGNNLALPEESIGDIVAIALAADALFRFEDAVVEISTSLVGRIDPQIERARAIMRAMKEARTRIDPRFVVVANTALASEPYWRNLDGFVRAMEEERGGRRDGTGDILQLNIATSSLPDVDRLCDILAPYRFPVNLTWTPAFDAGARSEEGLALLASWVGRFHRRAASMGMDANVVTRTAAARGAGADTLAEAVRAVEGSASNVIYVAPDGSPHEGFTSVLAEMDPVRYDPSVGRGGGRSRVVSDARAEVSRLARNRACAACPHLPLCVATGAFRVGLIALRGHPAGTRACPSGMREAFEAATQGGMA